MIKNIPEISWMKRQCPICLSDTGDGKECKNSVLVEDDSLLDEQSPNSISAEFNGIEYPLQSDQCLFKQYRDFFIHCNYPISTIMAHEIGRVEGVERIYVLTKYRALITIGEQFEEQTVKQLITHVYNEICKECFLEENNNQERK